MGTQDAYTKTDQLLITAFFCLETFTRHLLMAIISLDLLNHLENTQRVTLFTPWSRYLFLETAS